jgi:hypothetical protein
MELHITIAIEFFNGGSGQTQVVQNVKRFCLFHNKFGIRGGRVVQSILGSFLFYFWFYFCFSNLNFGLDARFRCFES